MKQEMLIELTEQQKWLIDRESSSIPAPLHIAWEMPGVVAEPALMALAAHYLAGQEALCVTLEKLPGVLYPLQRVGSASQPATELWEGIDNPDSFLQAIRASKTENEHASLIVGNGITGSAFAFLRLPAVAADAYTLLHAARIITGILGGNTDIPEPQITFTQYAGWQSETLADLPDEIREWQLAKEKAPCTPDLLPLAGKKPAGAATQYVRSEKHFVRPDILQIVDVLATHCGSPATVWTALYACLLQHLGGDPAIHINCLLSGRVYPELNETLGLLDQFAPIRIEWEGILHFSELVQQTDRLEKENQAVAEYFSLAFLQKTGAEAVRASLSYQPSSALPGCLLALETGNPPSLLHLEVVEHPTGAYYQWTFDAHTISVEAIGQANAIFGKLLELLPAGPDLLLSRENLTGKPLLAGTPDTFSPDFLALFRDQCLQCPHQTALRSTDTTYSYQELDLASDKAAAYLYHMYRLRPDDLVALRAERSPEAVVAIIAILKAGAAFLPLDPSWPGARSSAILREAAPRLLLTDTLRQDEPAPVLALDQLLQASRESRYPVADLPAPNGRSRAYVIYTSGTTGNPKGCVLSRANLAHYLHWCRDAYFSKAGGNMAWFTPLSFDLTITSIFCPLILGKSLTVIPAEAQVDEALAASFSDPEIDTVKLTPSHISLLDSLHLPGSPVKIAITGGEALRPDQLAALFALNPALEVYNEYGPTEATVGCIVKKLSFADDRITIGHPIDRMATYVVNNNGQPLLPGLSGELLLGGAGIAMGYLANPQLTQEKFVTPGWADGSLLYKTGDLARVLPNGELDFLGRADQQVKIRGYRIELAEIIHHLRQVDGISDAYVCAVANGSEQALAAFICSTTTQTDTDIIQQLQESLPEYMVPGRFYRVSQIPLTANGKIDERRLLTHELTLAEPEPQSEPPVGKIEESIAATWGELLHTGNLSRHDDFFRLGGQSIRAAQLVARLRRMYSVHMSLKDVFEHNTIATQAALVSRLKSENFDEPVILPVQDNYPASGAQWRIWTAHHFQPVSTAYNMPAALLISGPFSKDLFVQSLRRMVARFETLRTSFNATPEGLRQVIHRQATLALTEQDLSAIADPDIDHLCTEHASRYIDLAQYPLYRATLIQLPRNQWLFLLNVHHILVDGLSEQVLWENLEHNYSDLAAGNGEEPAVPPYQYKEYAAWKNKMEARHLDSESHQYWKRQLATPLPVVELYAPGKAVSKRIFEADSYHYRFPDQVTQLLTACAGENRVSLFTFLVTLSELLIARYSGQDEILLGIPVDNRQHEVFEQQAGFFLNTLVFRNRVDSAETVATLIRTTHQTLLEGMEHRHFPFELLARELAGPDNNGERNIFSVLINFQERPHPREFSIGDVRFRKLATVNRQSKVDLAFNFALEAGQLVLDIDFTTDHFTTPFIIQMLRHWEYLASCLADHLHQPVAALPAMPPEDARTLEGWGKGPAPLNTFARGIYPRFAEVAGRFENNVAIIAGNDTYTYKSLHQRVKNLAYYLATSLEIQPGDLVAVLAARNLETVTTLLALRLCGAIYLPVDAAYPAERLQLILAESAPAQVLDASGTGMKLEGRNIASLPPFTDEQSNLRLVAADSATAYMIFTSGTTGKPKGVPVTDRGFMNMIEAQVQAFGITPSDRCLWFSSPSFDASLSEIFLALHTGAALFLVDADTLRNQHLFTHSMECNCVTVATLPPAYAVALPKLPESLKVLISAGEELRPEAASRLAAHCRVFNAYGPTENAVCTTIHLVQPGDAIIPIGRPIAGVKVKIADHNGSPLPPGIAGELHIAGPGLSPGYYYDTPQTESAFYVQHGERWYRSGDWAWWHEGELVFAGRRDGQLKIRGNRVETGDIRSFLLRQPGVREAVVHYTAIAESGKVLIAYIVPKAGADIATQDLGIACRAGLPSYMAPDFYVLIEEVPLNINGKTDYGRLPLPQPALAQQGEKTDTGTDPILAAFRGVLHRDDISADTDFFAAGGNSLAAILLISELYRETGINLSFGDVYENPTARQLALLLADREKPAANELREGDTPYLGWTPATPMQQKLFADMEMDHSDKYLMPGVISITGPLDMEAFVGAMHSVIDRHEALRYRFRASASGLEFNVGMAFPEQVTLAGSENPPSVTQAGHILRELLLAPVDPLAGPMCRLALVRVDEQSYLLGFMLHHLVGDAWSVKNLVKDLFAAYQAESKVAPSLPPTPGYQAYARAMAVLPPFYPDRKSIAARTLEVRPAARSRDSAMLDLVFEKDVREGLRSLALQYEISSLAMVSGLLSLSLASFSGQQLITIFTPLHGRYDSQWHDTIGLFMNVVPLTAELDSETPVRSMLQAVHKQYLTLTAPAHKDAFMAQWTPTPAELPSGKALVEVQLDDLEQHFSHQALEVNGLKLGMLPMEDFTMHRKFDLEFHCSLGTPSLEVTALYDAACFTEAQVSGYLLKTEQLLHGLLREPGLSVSTLLENLESEQKKKLKAAQQSSIGDFFKSKRS